MRERPILFSGPMVRAILIARKTQTRRLVTQQTSTIDGPHASLWPYLVWDDRVFVDRGPSPAGNPGPYLHVHHDDGDTRHRVYSRWWPGDRLWVRETWAPVRFPGKPIVGIHYAAGPEAASWLYKVQPDTHYCFPARPDQPDEQWPEGYRYGWLPSIHMPRWASRITLEITDVRVQRLQEISEEDAKVEGVTCRSVDGLVNRQPGKLYPMNYRQAFMWLWDEINGKRASWESNPWVWAISFRRVETPQEGRK